MNNVHTEEILQGAVRTAVKERNPKDSVEDIVGNILAYMEDWTGSKWWGFSSDLVESLVRKELLKNTQKL